MTQNPHALIARWTDELAGVRTIDWARLEGGRLLLTGCTGPFGLWILNRISRACEREGLELAETTLVTRHAAAAAPWLNLLSPRCRLRIVECDIRQIDAFKLDPTHVIHGATTTARETSAGASPEAKFETVVDGTRALLRSLGDRRPLKLLYLSSGIVYGTSNWAHLNEADLIAPSTLDSGAGLAQAKRTAEFLLASHTERTGGTLTVARCFSFSGPGMPLDLHYALGNFILQAQSGQDIVIRGDGQDVRSYLHLGDMALWVLTMLTRAVEPYTKQLFNVGSDKRVTIEQLAALVAQRVNPNAAVRVLGEKNINRSGNFNPLYVPSIQKARTYLNLDAWTDLADSIDQMNLFSHPKTACSPYFQRINGIYL
jgi:dTDP-glucose 4,6-dehydratase/UDP-glucose 4-epimerase